jgi:hypothetical protein
MAKGSKHARQRFSKWINSYPDVSAWLEKYGDLEQQLADDGGLVKIENFLPIFVAEGILEMLQGINDKTWNVSDALAAGCRLLHELQRQQHCCSSSSGISSRGSAKQNQAITCNEQALMVLAGCSLESTHAQASRPHCCSEPAAPSHMQYSYAPHLPLFASVHICS